MTRNIKLITLILLLLSISNYKSNAEETVTPVDFVNPLTGTLSKYELSHGNTYPVIALPWGMNFWTPQTGKMGDGWQYKYTADKVRGLKQTHQPSPWMNDYGQFSLMPISGALKIDEEARASWFSHKSEIAKPYYYALYLADYHIEAELAPTERAASFRFKYPTGRDAHLIIDAFDHGSMIEIQPELKRIIGYTTRNSGGVPENFRNYFVIQFKEPFIAHALYNRKDSLTTIHQGNRLEEWHVHAAITFPQGTTVHAEVASSFISPEQAILNLNEIGGRTIEEVATEGKKKWNNVLGKIEIEDDNIDQKRTFYSALYRSLLFPRRFYEYATDGTPWHYSPYNGQVLPGYIYTDTGFWDTFRSLFPLLNLLYPEENTKIQEGLVNAFKESGFLPEWASPGHRDIMVGNNSASVVADAYIKGLRGYDIEKLWEAVVHGAHNKHPKVNATGRYGHEHYNTIGYVPSDIGINESAARTLEYAYNDWCILKLGQALGKSDTELAPYKERAYNYRNLFDPKQNLMRGRKADGTWEEPFNPFSWGGAFTEGNSWHYTWSVFHDPAGLINLMGGAKTFNAMLDSIFTLPPIFDATYYGGYEIHEIREMRVMNMGNYAHGNQPIQHMIYLYNYSGEPWKAQYWSREVMEKLYSASPDGYCGDEDNGQTSAWYVFSALGFYPVAPGTDQYAIGAPLFDKMILHLPNGKTLTLEAKENNINNRYIQELTINGKPSTRNYFTHHQLTNGGTIHYHMGDTPNKKRGTTPSDAPYSYSLEKTHIKQ